MMGDRSAYATFSTVIVALWVLGSSAQADSYGHVQGATTKSENVLQAEAYMASGEWAKAVPLLEARNAGYPDEVETLADLGHAYAMTDELDLAIEKLKIAIDLEPRHLEANLYLGEAYLLRNDLANAQLRLDALDQICFFGCGAYKQLKSDILKYKSGANP